jgi:hypothetical protein
MVQVKLNRDVINGITQGYFCLIFGWIDGWKVIFFIQWWMLYKFGELIIRLQIGVG